MCISSYNAVHNRKYLKSPRWREVPFVNKRDLSNLRMRLYVFNYFSHSGDCLSIFIRNFHIKLVF